VQFEGTVMLKVLTLNLNYYGEKHGKWTDRQKLITAAINEAQPDILAFQAVRTDPHIAAGKDQAAQIASRFDHYPYVHFQPAITYHNYSAEGSALVSRYPFVEINCQKLSLQSGSDDLTHRVVLHARFSLETGSFHLFNAHFSWVDDQAQDNLEETLPFLESFEGHRMLVGDLNTVPDSSIIKRFEEAGWTDAWATLHPQENGYTFYESDRLSKRIDYALVDPSLEKRLHSVCTIADMEDDRGARPSDHVGLLVDLDISMG
jgi:endonuclease/exonuclease/phosphatase family metal-dependent hydrolase